MRFFLSFIAVLIIDQLSKYLVVSSFVPGESREVIAGIFSLTYVQNTGAAFGVLEGAVWFFILSAILVIGGMIYYNLKYSPPAFLKYTLGIIAGGALGNLIDRVFYKSVIDFISVGWWPVFNVADIAIVCGSILMIIYVLFNERKSEAEDE